MTDKQTCTFRLPVVGRVEYCGREAHYRFVMDRDDFKLYGEFLEAYFCDTHLNPARVACESYGYTWKEYLTPPYVTCCDVHQGPRKPRPSCQVLLAIHPKHARAILSGKKRIEFRRVGWKNPEVHGVFLYATAPVSKIVGHYETNMGDYGKESIGRLRSRFRAVRGTGLTIQAFNEYFAGKDEGFYSYCYEPTKFKKPVELSELGLNKLGPRLGTFQAPKRPPQNWVGLVADYPWLCMFECECDNVTGWKL